MLAHPLLTAGHQLTGFTAMHTAMMTHAEPHMDSTAAKHLCWQQQALSAVASQCWASSGPHCQPGRRMTTCTADAQASPDNQSNQQACTASTVCMAPGALGAQTHSSCWHNQPWRVRHAAALRMASATHTTNPCCTSNPPSCKPSCGIKRRRPSVYTLQAALRRLTHAVTCKLPCLHSTIMGRVVAAVSTTQHTSTQRPC
ncbi:hypothetical protein COO60DRAFT_1477736 [Scenedesmus sp. NREL 46B-D3]|nr:hypothetical protein COO60DRAFT_1477736 [Scenedesmus sp. NREL 46B-D3]